MKQSGSSKEKTTMSSELDRFLAAASRPLRTIEIRIGSEVFMLRELCESDAADMEVSMQKGESFDFAKHRRLLVSYCLVDRETCERIVTDSDMLKKLPRMTVGKLYEECLKLTEYDAKEIESLAKKSDAI
jgi:hypothetical protein